MKYWIITFGCQMNWSDSERIASILEKIDYKPASNINGADLIVVNMCSVRQSAVDRVFGLFPKFKKIRERKNLKTILTGCILEKDRKKLEKGFDELLNIKEIPKLPQILKNSANFNIKDYLKIDPKFSDKFSALVPIMTGCNNFCAYCAVPYTRGREASRSADEIICEIKNLAQKGFKEFWLLGENVNSYKDGKIDFPKLIKKINELPGNFWLRFTSPHPKDFSDKLIDVIASCEKITEYINLPVQAGDDTVLKNMNRPYTIDHYKKLVKKIRKRIPDVCLSTDVIVGFPGETKEQFENTVRLFEEIEYDMAYIAKYSERPGTAAAEMEDDVKNKEKTRRERVLTSVLKKTALKNNKRYLNKKVIALIDGNKKEFWFGKTKRYKTIRIKSNKNLMGNFVKAKVTKVLPWGLEAELCKK